MDNTFLINEDVIDTAKNICKYITDSYTRNRAVANVVASMLAKEYFSNYDVDTASSLHNVCNILESWDLADIYINGCYIDVRVCFRDSDLKIPKSHFDNDLLPFAYMFIELDENLAQAVVKGFVLPEDVQVLDNENGYYLIDESILKSFYDVEPLLTYVVEDLPEDFELLMYEYLDGKLEDDKIFCKLLLNSKDARLKLIDAANAKNIFNFVSIDSAINSSIETDVENDQEEFVEIEKAEEENEESIIDEAVIIEQELVIDDLDNTLDDLYQNVEELAIDSDLTGEGLEAESGDLIGELIEETIDFSQENQPETSENLQYGFDEDILLESEDSNNEESFEYTTITTPSIDSIEQEIVEDLVDEQEYADINNELNDETVSSSEENTIDEGNNIAYEESSDFISDNSIVYDESLQDDTELPVEENEEISVVEDNVPQLETLFSQETESVSEEELIVPVKAKSTAPLLGVIAFALLLGYWGFTKFTAETPKAKSNVQKSVDKAVQKETVKTENKVAMPVETVDNIDKIDDLNQGNAISIPAIEQNLDASILVSNLTVNWEVPASYASNSAVRRYFTKLGKIIQLNLKTELLLLNKPPITNKIVLDLDYNKSTQRFVVKAVSVSSGEKTVDDLIVQTVRNVLSMSLSTNTNIFNNIQGSPALVIRL
ncbi:MAG: hypothetical protein E7Z92_05015 [Cyanobacteria bacterium SIG31]|nr:hypothetical protein [Cyanobacteria bacterium SIG31]